MDEEGKDDVFLIEIIDAMSPIPAKAVMALKDYVKTNISVLYEQRPIY